MTPQELKDQIIYDRKLRDVLESLKMKSIKEHSDYFSCGMPDGDNTKSTIVYKESLYVDAHTRNIKDAYGNSDILALVMFIKQCYFSSALRFLCEVCGYDYYGESFERPKVLSIFSEIFEMRSGKTEEIEKYNSKPIDEYLLSYYKPFNSKLFYDDGISYKVQRMFDIRYDGFDDRIVIPIRDEDNVLVGLKGRLNKTELLSFENKYIYLTDCNKSSILFGLYFAYEAIKREGIVYVSESEKGVMQAMS